MSDAAQQGASVRHDDALGFVSLDAFGVIGEITQGVAEFLEVDPMYVPGLPFCVFVTSGDGKKFFDHLRRCEANGGSALTEISLRRRTQIEVSAQLRSEPGHSATGQPCYRTALVVASEWRAQKRDGSRARHASAVAVRESKDQFLGTVAHELRNALTPLMMSLPLLKKSRSDSARAERMHAVIERQVTHMNRLVNDLLDMTRVGYGKIRLKVCRIELNDLVRSVVETHRALFEQRNVHLEAACAAAPLVVFGDPDRLTQVLENLLLNALKFTDHQGGVLVSVAPDGGRAILRVRDTGIGIASESLCRLFDPFVQANATLDRNRGGLGLGLAVVKNLVELHGGSVSATSAGLGLGSEFVVSLPLAGESEVFAAHAGEAQHRVPATPAWVEASSTVQAERPSM